MLSLFLTWAGVERTFTDILCALFLLKGLWGWKVSSRKAQCCVMLTNLDHRIVVSLGYPVYCFTGFFMPSAAGSRWGSLHLASETFFSQKNKTLQSCWEVFSLPCFPQSIGSLLSPECKDLLWAGQLALVRFWIPDIGKQHPAHKRSFSV